MLALLYLAGMIYFGDRVCRYFYRTDSIQHRLATSFLVGLLLSSIVTYLASLAFAWTTQPLIFGNLVFLAVVVLAALKMPGRPRSLYYDAKYERPEGEDKWDWLCLGLFFVFSCWLMFSTLSFPNGDFQFGYKSWSDFGANLSVSQSFIFGHNFPSDHPFFPGEILRYHFLFWFQSANLSFLGLSLVAAVNLLSILSMMSVAILIMAFAERVFGSRNVGRIAAALFFVGSSSLSYIPFLYSHASLGEALSAILKTTQFLNSGFPYRGEGWGALTVDIYANQRHLASGIGLLFVVLIFLVGFFQHKRSREIVFAAPIPNPATPQVFDDMEPDDAAPANDTATDDVPAPPYDLEPEATEQASETGTENTPASLYEIDSDDDTDEAAVDELLVPEPEIAPDISEDKPERAKDVDFWSDLKPLLFSGAIVGMLPFWNSAVFVAAAIILGSLFLLFPYRRYLACLIGMTILIGLPQVLLLRSGDLTPSSYSLFTWGYTIANPTLYKVVEFLLWTFGFKWLLIVIALWFLTGSHRRLFLALSSLVPVVFLFQLSTDAFNNHKLLNIWEICASLFAAYALWRIGKGGILRSAFAVVLTLTMCLGAIIDLFPVYNDPPMKVAYRNDRLTNWVFENTQPTDIFLTQTHLTYPILSAGRRIYLGATLFAWTAGYQVGVRQAIYTRMFQESDPDQLVRLLNENKIAYVCIDDGLKSNDLIRNLNESVFQEHFEKVFVDTERQYGNLTIYKVPAGPGGGAPANNPAVSGVDTSIPAVTAFEGGQGKGRGQLNGPRGIAVDAAGNFYIADTGNARVEKFSPDGNYLATVGFSGVGGGELQQPNGIAVDPAGNIYVADASSQRLLTFNPDGTPGKQLSASELKYFGARSVVTGPNKLLYVLDQGNSRVAVVDPASDRVFEWGKYGTGDGEFVEPTGLEIGDNRVYVADTGNNRIQTFDLDGKFISQWPVPEWTTYPWRYPDMAFDIDTRKLYVTSPIDKEILVFDSSGNRLESLKPTDTAALENPSALAIAATTTNKRLYVVNTGSSKVSIFELPLGTKKVKTPASK